MISDLRPHLIVRESVLNLVTGGIRSAMLVLVAGVIFLASGFMETVEVSATIDQSALLAEQGRYVLEVTPAADSDSPILAAGCESLQHQGGINAAGALVASQLVEVTSAPGARVRYTELTPGAFRVVVPRQGPPQNGALLGSALAVEFGLVAGSQLALVDQGVIRFSAVLAENVRLASAERAILVPSISTGSAVACYAEVDPAVFDDYRTGGLSALAHLSDEAVQIVPLVRLDEGESPERRYTDRITRYAGHAAATLTVVFLVTLLLGRRSEIGLYRAVGTSRSALYLILLGEYSLAIAISAVASCATLAIIGSGNGIDPWRDALVHGYASMWSAVALSVAGLSLVLPAFLVGRNVIDALKDRG